MTEPSYSLVERAAAVGLLLGLLGAAAWSLLAAPLEAAAARAEASGLAPRSTDARAEAGAAFDPAEVVAAYRDESEAQLTLQALVDRLARAAGLSVEALRPATPEALGGLGDVAWVEASAIGDLQAVADFLTLLDAERPLILVRLMEADAAGEPRPDAALRLRLEVGRAWRAGDGP